MSEKKVYLKLGDNAYIFTNTLNDVIIRNKEVVEVDENLLGNDNSIREALKGGHIVKAEKKDFDEWENQKPSKPEELSQEELAKKQGMNKVTGKGAFNEMGQPVNEAGVVVEKPEGKTTEELDEMTKKELVQLIEESEAIPTNDKDEKMLKKMDADSLVSLYKKYYKTESAKEE